MQKCKWWLNLLFPPIVLSENSEQTSQEDTSWDHEIASGHLALWKCGFLGTLLLFSPIAKTYWKFYLFTFFHSCIILKTSVMSFLRDYVSELKDPRFFSLFSLEKCSIFSFNHLGCPGPLQHTHLKVTGLFAHTLCYQCKGNRKNRDLTFEQKLQSSEVSVCPLARGKWFCKLWPKKESSLHSFRKKKTLFIYLMGSVPKSVTVRANWNVRNH